MMEQYQKVSFITVSLEQADQRIDNFLFSRLKGVPKSHVYRLLRKGEIRVNKKRIRAEYRLQERDQIRLAPIRVAETLPPPKASDKLISTLEESILYEDKFLLILNKPAGLAVHGGSGISLGLIEALRQARPNEKALELVHRIDRDTSGCLIIAKRRSTLRALHEQLREGQVTKKYLLVVKGKVPNKHQFIKARLEKNTLASGERMVRVSDEGKAAKTEFHVKQDLEESTLLEATLHTGRTHQIRVHAQYMGHPIGGDQKYGDKEFNKLLKNKGIPRLLLHARSLEFSHPNTDDTIFVEAPLDVYFVELGLRAPL